MSISLSGLEFYDTLFELDFEDKEGAPDFFFGSQFSKVNFPLDFEYLSTDSVSSFVAVKYNNLGKIEDTITLSTSLIESDGTSHKCDGLTEYTTHLEKGIYKYVVNDRYVSAKFRCFSPLRGINYDIIEKTLIVYDNDSTS
jgi:hypothetical protein